MFFASSYHFCSSLTLVKTTPKGCPEGRTTSPMVAITESRSSSPWPEGTTMKSATLVTAAKRFDSRRGLVSTMMVW